jgi:lyso-ornithine lipid O-acyltransferase
MRGAARVASRAARSAFAALAALGDLRLPRRRTGRGGRSAAVRAIRAARLQRTFAEVAAVHDLHVAVEGRVPTGPCLLVANHVGYLDPIVLGALVPCTIVAKREVASWPIIGPAAAQLGVLFVDRRDVMSRAAVLLGAVRALRAGVTVLDFPEGTTTDGVRLLPFSIGIFGAARLAGVPVVPAAVRYGTPDVAWTGGQTFLPHYARTAARRSLSAVVRLGAPIPPAELATASALAAAARRAVADLLDPKDPDEPREPVRLSPPRPDPVLPPAERGPGGDERRVA